MGTFLKDTGFEKKTLAEIKVELETAFQEVFGDNIDLDGRGPFGQIIGIISKNYADLWDLAEEIYTARNPYEATGKSLDDIAAETGVIRLDATPTQIRNTILYGTEGTIVAAGKQVKQETNDLTASLSVNVTIQKANAREIQLEPNTTFPLSGGEVFTVTIDGTPYTYNGIAADTKGDVIDELKTLIDAGSWLGNANNISDTYLQLIDIDLDFSVSFNSNLDEELLGSGGLFIYDDDGANIVPANTLIVIVTPVAGWDSVNNPEAGETGRAVETDDEFRIRRAQLLLAGNATDLAIRRALLNEIEGIQTAVVTSNRTNVTDGSGRPAKSFEAVVEGGADQDIADKIWEVQPSGIESYGNTTINVTDSENNLQEIKFSRPEALYIWVKVKRDLNPEETYPTDGDNLIKQEIVDWALANLEVGDDVIRQRLSEPVYSVPGIGDIEISLDYSTNIGHSPTYSLQNAPVTVRQLANFATARIVVEVLTP
jgi:uncharacterized phage protein gp47/JayE